MVKIYPDNLDSIRDNMDDSEKDFYLLCKNSLGSDWVVWHSVEWLGINNLYPGETDYLVLNKKIGFLTIEVKGGGIRIENGTWKTIDRYQVIHNIKDPFRQARNAMFFFAKKYVNSAKKNKNFNKLVKKDSRDNLIFPGLIWYGVFFPDCYFKNKFKKRPSLLGMDDSFIMIFDKEDRDKQELWEKLDFNVKSPLEMYLLDIFNLVKQKKKLYRVSLPSEAASFFISLITPKLQTDFQLNSTFNSYEQQIKEFEKYEEDILDSIKYKKRCLFKGSAGTGKTYIAMKKAMMFLNKKKILFLCYNRELMAFIRKYISDICSQNKKNSIQIYTIHGFLKKFLSRCLPLVKDKQMFSLLMNDEFAFSEAFDKLFKEGNIQKRFLFDAIIVDEAQDINENIWPLIQYFKKNQSTPFFIFFDDDQKKFNPTFTPKQFGMETDDIFKLNRNLRNCDKIIKWITETTDKGNYTSFLGISGFNVEISYHNNFKNALIDIFQEIYKLNYEEKIQLDKIIVLCDKKLKYLTYYSFVSKKTLKDDQITYNQVKYKKENKGYSLIEPSKNIKFSKISQKLFLKDNSLSVLFNSIGTFKGLEKEIVFLLINKPDQEMSENIKRDIYIGASRARFLLSVHFYQ